MMVKDNIIVYSLVSIIGTIGGAFTIILAFNRNINAFLLRTQFKRDFVNDMRKHQLKTKKKKEDRETKVQIETQFKWLFSFEGMYAIFNMVSDHQEDYTKHM